MTIPKPADLKVWQT